MKDVLNCGDADDEIELLGENPLNIVTAKNAAIVAVQWTFIEAF